MKIYLLAAFVISTFRVFASPPEEQGKLIFNSRCAACHNVNKVLTGPALAGIDQRRSIEWIVNFVQSSQTMVKGGDKEAVALFEQFNRIPMPDHKDLTVTDVQNILDYIKTNTVAADAEAQPFSRPARLRPAYVPVSVARDSTFLVAFFGAVIVLIAVLLLWVNVKEIERSRRINDSQTLS